MFKFENSSLFIKRAYVNGAWVEADNGSTVTVTNPANGNVIITAPWYCHLPEKGVDS